MTNLDSILKSRDITLSTKVHLVKAMFFPVVMYGCESWTIKKAERRRIVAFQLWCWRSLLRNLYSCQEGKVRTGHGTTDCFQLGKEYIKAVYCHSAYLTYMQSTSWKRWAGGSTSLREISITSDIQMTPPYCRSWRRVKNFLIKVKVQS